MFANVADPVGAGIVSSLPKPDGMTTGFVNYEYPMGGKWLETLKEIAPGVSQFAVIYADSNPSFVGSMREIQSAATRLQVQITAMPVRNEADIESSIDLLGRQSNVGAGRVADRTSQLDRKACRPKQNSDDLLGARIHLDWWADFLCL